MKYKTLTLIFVFILKILLRIFGIVYIPIAIAGSIIACCWSIFGWIIVGKKSFDQGEDLLELIWVGMYCWIGKTISSFPE